MAEREYAYYGFISYNRKDRKWALRLQKQLERYHLPRSLRKDHPDLPKAISPIFLDQSDLVAHDTGLAQSLVDKLDESKYLIVLCSPNSAGSSWVNDEIRHFIETGRVHQIIPVIIAGESHAKDPANECYPPALKDLSGSDKLLSIRIENHGWNGVILRLAATILGLRLDELAARDAAYRRRRRIFITLFTLIAAAAAFAAVWYNTPHTAYFRETVNKREIPTGLGKVSAEERKALPYTYRLTTLRGRVVRMERVNSAGLPVTGNGFTDNSAPIIHYSYENNGTLSRAVYYDVLGQPLFEVNYSADLRILDFVQSESGYSYSLTGGDIFTAQQPGKSVTESHNDVIRYVQDYDESGLLVRRMFKRDNRGSTGGTPVRNSEGIWGESYTYDEQDRVISVCGTDPEGAVMAGANGIACRVNSYDEAGRLTDQILNGIDGAPAEKDGTASTRLTYDDYGRIIRLDYFDTDGQLFSREAASISYEYDEHGFTTGIRYFDSRNAPYYRDGYTVIHFTNDAQGHPVRQQFQDANGQPVNCTSGYAEIVFTYEDDHLIEYHYLDRNGMPSINTEIHASGIRNTWTDGFLTRFDYLDTEGERTIGNNGFASICYAYNSDRQLEKEWYLDTQDQPVRCGSGFAAQTFSYVDGNVSQWDYLDEQGEPCADSTGTASIHYVYEGGLLISREYFGTDGQPVLRAGYYHREENTYDDFGQLLSLTYFGTEGERVNNEDNYSSVHYTRDESGRIASETFFETNDLETSVRENYDASRVLFEYDRPGNIVRALYQSDLTRPEDLVSEVISKYDRRGNLIESSWLNTSGQPVRNANGFTRIRTIYDSTGLITERRFYSDESGNFDSERYEYDAYGRQTAVLYSGNGLTFRAEYTYDEYGARTAEQYLNGDGELTDPGSGWARVENSYDAFGNKTDIRYFGTNGKPVMYDGTCAHAVMRYDNFGRCISAEYFDEEDRPTEESGSFKWIRTYNDYGWPVEEVHYNIEGFYVGKIAWIYSPSGEVEGIRYYDRNGEEIRAYLHIPVITAVMEDNAAAEAGIAAGDILLQYGSWTFDRALSDPGNWMSSLQEESALGRENEKRIVVLYTAEDGREENGPVPGFGFVDVVFPPGLIGIEMGGIDLPTETCEALLSIWEEYQGK